MHAVFLYHAIQAGLDMAIVNAGALPVYDEIDPELLQRIEDAIFNLRPDATGRLLDIAENIRSQSQGHDAEEKKEEWREHSLNERIHYALIKGNDTFIESDIEEATGIFPSALSIIEGPLMEAMGMVGTRFGEGKMFLPQVVKSARVMKRAVEVLEPRILAEKKKSGSSSENKKILLATVKGDVHDIGKNIVGVVLGCNNYEVIDLGVMVPADKIIETALTEKADIIGLSGLITPSLDEMIHVVKTLEKRGLSIPVIIGGATTSEVHTAVKIAPEASFPVVYSRDASSNVAIVSALLSEKQRDDYITRLKNSQSLLRENWKNKQTKMDYISLDQARENKLKIDWIKTPPVIPHFTGQQGLPQIAVSSLRPYIQWNAFFKAWQMPGQYPAIFSDLRKGDEAKALFKEANHFLDKLDEEGLPGARGVFAILPANAAGEDIIIYEDETRKKEKFRFYGLREQIRKSGGEPNLCLSDFLAPEGIAEDYIGFFALASELKNPEPKDPWQTLLTDTLAHRLAEAAAEWLHTEIRQSWWGYEAPGSKSVKEILHGNYQGIRPAFGYPSSPDHSEKATLFSLLKAEEYGIHLTENYVMDPQASVCGMIFTHPQSQYFMLQCLSREQISLYAQRKRISEEEIIKLLPSNLILK
jgi:5-methyltetrahydrofolate--homocysteine methyltransferase